LAPKEIPGGPVGTWRFTVYSAYFFATFAPLASLANFWSQ